MTRFDGLFLPIVMIVVGVVALVLTVYGRRTALPGHRARPEIASRSP